MNVLRQTQRLLTLAEGRVALVAIICAACAHEPTAPQPGLTAFDPRAVIPDLKRDLPGTWMAPFSVAGSGEIWTLALTDSIVSGRGTWSAEACCNGTVSVNGVVRGDSVHLDLLYSAGGLSPQAVHLDGVVDRPIDLVGVARRANGMIDSVRYVKSTAVSPANAALDRLVWWNDNVTFSVALVADAANIYALSADHVVSAIDRASGRIVWQTSRVPDFTGGSLAMAAGLLVVGQNDLYALDPKNGKEVWRIAASANSAPGFPSVVDGSTLIATTNAGQVFALDARTGATKWTARVVADTETAPQVDVFSPRVANGVVYAAFTRVDAAHFVAGSGLAAVDESSGRLLWSTLLPGVRSIGASGSSAVALAPASLMALGFGDTIYVFDRQSGRLTTSLPPEMFSPPGSHTQPFSIAAFGNTLAVGTEGQAPITLSALDATTLHPLWQTRFQSAEIDLLAPDGGRVYAVATYRDGPLGVFDLATGQQVWRLEGSDLRPAGERIGALPVFDDQRVYLGGDQGLYALKKN